MEIQIKTKQKKPSVVTSQLHTKNYKIKDILHVHLKMHLPSVSALMPILLAKISSIENCEMQPRLLPLYSYALNDVCSFVSTVTVKRFWLCSLGVMTQVWTIIKIQALWCQATYFLQFCRLIQSLSVCPVSICRRLWTASSVSHSLSSSVLNSS